MKKSIYLFGSGPYGQLALKKLRKKYNILGFIDNDKSKQGKKIDNIEIFNPSKLKELNFDSIFITSMYVEEIKKQIIQLNIDEKKIELIQFSSIEKRKINLISKYGDEIILLIVLYPFFLPFIMLKDMSLSIYNIIKSLINYKWRYLSGNDQKNAYNNLFYYIQSYNIQKFGRYETSNILAGGNFSLKNWFHITPFSLKLQANLGTTFIMFFAMCFWILSLIILYHNNPNLWIVIVVVFSTIFFATFVEIQNYNILGWMYYPIFLSSLTSEHYLFLTIILLLIAFSSFTAFFIAGILLIISSIYLRDYYLILAIIPATIKWILPIIISIKNGAINKMARSIGVHNKVKYNRTSHKKLNTNKIYIFSLQIQFLLFSFIESQINLYLILVSIIIGLFILNELFIRFADQQSFYLAYLSVTIIFLLNTNFTHLLFISFIFSIYPIYGFIMNVFPRKKSFIGPGVRKPYSVEKDINNLIKLFETIPKNEKCLVAYKNPQGKYSSLFNGYRTFNEPIQYAATLRNICLFPDWYMIFDNNKENDDESFWINTEQEAINYMKNNNIKYLLLPDFQKFELNQFISHEEFKFIFEDAIPPKKGFIYSLKLCSIK